MGFGGFYPTYSHVTTILSPETNVSVLDQVTQDTGVVAGSLEYAAAGQVEMRFLTAENKLKAGDIIVTSGVGGVYPGELPVGEVVGKKAGGKRRFHYGGDPAL